MVSLICILFLVICILFAIKYFRAGYGRESLLHEISFMLPLTLCFMVFIICFFNICSYLGILVTKDSIDENIKIYEEQNAKIEENIELIINSLLNDKDSYVDGEESIIFAESISEFNDNKYIKKQLETYNSNLDTILELKKVKTSISECKWNLYFGS